ncbi:MAG: response regulator transcription factor [Verrucomicrobia bacterium]|nr:response regulator transcription factor [Verrucomicrobiota bacterium]
MKPRRSTTAVTARKRILVVDDHPIMREGLAQLINHEPDLSVCGEAESSEQAVSAVEKLRPDLVLADITLPGKSGVELIKDLQALRPGLAVLVLSMHDESLYAERVLRAGGRGYIMKQEGGRKLMEAIRHVLGGQVYVSARMSARILELFSGQPAESERSPLAKLTDREFEVYQLIGAGKSTRDVAGQLHLSVKTVEVHRANIKKKLGVRSAPELVRHAVRWVETQRAG